ASRHLRTQHRGYAGSRHPRARARAHRQPQAQRWLGNYSGRQHFRTAGHREQVQPTAVLKSRGVSNVTGHTIRWKLVGQPVHRRPADGRTDRRTLPEGLEWTRSLSTQASRSHSVTPTRRITSRACCSKARGTNFRTLSSSAAYNVAAPTLTSARSSARTRCSSRYSAQRRKFIRSRSILGL